MSNTTDDVFSTTPDYSSYYENSNDGFDPCPEYDFRTFYREFLVTIYILVFILGFLGNSLVVCVLMKHRNQTNMTDKCLLHLAASDILFIMTLPFYIQYVVVNEWTLGDLMCRFLSFAHHTGFYSSIFFMVIMTLDRYVVIMYSHKVAQYRTRKACYTLIAIVWFLSILVSLPTFIFSELDDDDQSVTCSYNPEKENWRYYDLLATNILGLVVPMLVMVVCYSRIIPTLVRMRTVKRHRVVKLIISIMAIFFVFWAPYHISRFLKFLFEKDIITGSCSFEIIIKLSTTVSETIAYTHCCLNPIIYAFVGQKFMRRALQLLKRWAPGPVTFTESSFRRSSVLSRSSVTSTIVMM